MTRVRTAAALLVLAAALLAAGCGGDDDDGGAGGDGAGTTEETLSAPTEWANELCSSITTWQDELTAIGQSLGQGGFSEDALSDAVEDGRNATDAFVDDLQGLGRPDTEAGQEAQDLITGLGDDLEADVQTIEDAAADVSSAADVVGAATSIGSTLQRMATELRTTLESLESLDGAQELRDAFEAADSCDGLRAP